MTRLNTATLDYRLITNRILVHRDELREIPNALTAACELARDMLTDYTNLDDKDRPAYVNAYRLDALLATIQYSAAYMAQTVHDLIGEDDSDLPTMQ